MSLLGGPCSAQTPGFGLRPLRRCQCLRGFLRFWPGRASTGTYRIAAAFGAVHGVRCRKTLNQQAGMDNAGAENERALEPCEPWLKSKPCRSTGVQAEAKAPWRSDPRLGGDFGGFYGF